MGDERGWVDDVLQRIMPMVMIVDWVLAPVALGMSGRLIAGRLVYPLGYGAYTLIRGPIVDWYPYLFLDPRQQGHVSMATGLVVLVIGFALLAVAVAALGALCGRRRGADERESDEMTWLSNRGG
ncbi:Pr6Pr family membrane protein [Nocardia sp. CA-120079]|uniref:Pr6Pr family membrane protein n=1 Tax=Nocardia sp. CA-120079 TaxID=3239974 RepID=UPI003D9747C0